MARIVAAHEQPWLDAAREIFREYGVSIANVAACSLQHQRFDEELAALPGLYAPPRGSMYVAVEGDHPGEVIGCIGLRPLKHLGPRVCELKRMYVRAAHRGRGVARALGERVIADARAAGYDVMKLDTSTSMTAAIALYRSLGFAPCERYNDDPMGDTLWFELPLRGR